MGDKTSINLEIKNNQIEIILNFFITSKEIEKVKPKSAFRKSMHLDPRLWTPVLLLGSTELRKEPTRRSSIAGGLWARAQIES